MSYWANSGSLFEHAVNVTTGNYIAANNLADYYLTEMRNEDARAPVMEALRFNLDYPEAHVNLATIMRRTGQMAESEREYQQAIRIQAVNASAHAGYGALLLQENRAGDAVGEFARVVELQPGGRRRPLQPGARAGVCGTLRSGRGGVAGGDPTAAGLCRGVS